MKAKNLLWGALACLAFAACSDDDVVVNPGGEDSSSNATSFLAVSITMPGNTTRATWGNGDSDEQNYQKGDDEEVTVKTAYLFFFDDEDNAWGTPRDIYADLTAAAGDGNGAFTDPDDAGQTIDKLSTPIIMFENQDVPHSVVAVLNLTSEQASALANSTLANFRKALAANSTKWNTTTASVGQGFIMSNSAYQDGEATAVYAQVLGEHLIVGGQNDDIESIRNQAIADPLVIPVERTLARVHVDFEETEGENNTQYTYTGSIYVWEGEAVVAKNVEIVSVVNGWWLHNTPTQSYLVKDLDNVSSETSITGWDTWNDQLNYRSYWAMQYNANTGDAPQQYVAQYYNMNNMADKYSFENTQQGDNKIELVVSANLWWKATTGAEWTRLDMVRWKQLNYTTDAFKQYVVKRIADELHITTITADKLSFNYNTTANDVEINDEAIADWQAILVCDFEGLTLEEGQETAITEFLEEQIGAFMYYSDGKTYYHTPIVHNELGTPATKLYGVIRNHYYQITVTGITGLGTPVPTPNPDDPDDPSDDPTNPDGVPEDPTDTDPEVPEEPEEPTEPDNPITPDYPIDDEVSAIATEIVILKYRIVTQSAGLSGGATSPNP